jgi:aspartate-semialdehyde dehydrogenase
MIGTSSAMSVKSPVGVLGATGAVGQKFLKLLENHPSCSVFDFKFALMDHNTIRGAAGASVLNAELLKAQGYLG